MLSIAWYTGATILFVILIHFVLRGVEHLRRRRACQQKGCVLPPSLPQKDPIFGIDAIVEDYRHFTSGTFLDLSRRRTAENGHTWSYSSFGRLSIATVDLENLRTVFITKADDYVLGGNRQSVTQPILGHNLLSFDGLEWRHARKTTRPGFAPDQVDIEPHFRNMLAQIPKDGTPFHLGVVFHKMVLSHIVHVLFGSTGPELDVTNAHGPQTSDISSALQAMIVWAQDILIYGSWATRWPRASCRKGLETVQAYVDHNITHVFYRLANGQRSSSVTEALSKRTTDRKFITNSVRLMMMVSETTISELLTATFYELGRHPEVWSKLAREIHDVLPHCNRSNLPASSDIHGLKFVSHVINETLRLYPTNPFNNRMALHDTVLPRGGGPDGSLPILVPRGAEVAIHQSPLFRREDLFGADPDTFNPDRWDTICPGDAFMPFAIGKRACAGMPIALEVASYVLVRMAMEFERIEDKSPDYRERIGINTSSYYGTISSLKPRSRNSPLGAEVSDTSQCTSIARFNTPDSGYSSEIESDGMFTMSQSLRARETMFVPQ